MRKFRFKFETLERVRKRREEEALRILSLAQKAFQSAQIRKQEFMVELNEALIRRENLGGEFVSVLTFQVENDFISGTKARILRQDHAIWKAQKGVEKALRAFLHARRQTRMMEILREKAFQEYKQDQRKREQRELDDLYVMRASLVSPLTESQIEPSSLGGEVA